MLKGELIVCFASLSWDYLWLRHQELMARFADAGNRVLFVEPIGIRMPGWQDRYRIAARLGNRRRAGTRGVRPVRERVWVCDPLVNPFQEVGFVHRRNVSALTAQLGKAIAEIGGGTPIVWSFVPTPLARQVIASLPHKLVIYDCMDALTENPKGVFSSFAASEQEFSRQADIVFVTSRTLLQRQLPLNPHTYYVPHGVEYEKFVAGDMPEPKPLARIPHPRLAFFGGIDERVDLDLLTQLGTRHPEWHILLMGVVRTSLHQLAALPNVHLLGHIAHDALASHLHHVDVFLLPYVKSAFSHYMNPAKLHECLAVGKPAVATALPAFDEFRDVLRVADTPAHFEECVQAALAEGIDTQRIARRRARALENTWDVRFQEINARMEAQLN